jgi:hypothetical protein
LGLAGFLTRYLSSARDEVKATDPPTFATVSLLVFARVPRRLKSREGSVFLKSQKLTFTPIDDANDWGLCQTMMEVKKREHATKSM